MKLRKRKMSLKLQQRRYKLLQLVHSRDTSSLRAKVAYILNQYPNTRSNDKLLTIKLWQTFYPEKIIDGDKILLEDMLHLPKGYDMQRYRAEIQNALGLFLPTLETQKVRRHQQDIWRDNLLLKDTPKITVFTDIFEGHDNLVIGSLWIYDSNRENMEHRMATHLIDIRKKENIPVNLMFTDINETNVDQVQEFFKAVLQFNEIISFKAHIVPGYRDRRYDEYELYERHLFKSIDGELNSHRIFPPKTFTMVKSADELPGIPEWEKKQEIKQNIHEAYGGDMVVDEIYSLKCCDSPLLQVTDFFTGSLNLAWEQGGQYPTRDYFAGYLLGLLNINPLDLSTYGDQDWVTVDMIE